MGIINIFLFIIVTACAFGAFLWAFHRAKWGIAASVALFLLGLVVYSQPGRTKPKPDIAAAQFAHALAVIDNAMSSFFMSRGGYDDFDGKDDNRLIQESEVSIDGNVTNLQVYALGPNFSTNITLCVTADFGDKDCEGKIIVSAKPAEPSEGFWKRLSNWFKSEKKIDSFKKWLLGFSRSLFLYYLFHALCYAYGAAFVCSVFGRRISNLLWLFSRVLLPCWKGRLVVFWDSGEESIAAAKSEQKDGRLPIFVFREDRPFSLKREPTARESILDSMLVPWVYLPPQEFRDSKWFSREVVRWLLKAPRHHLLSPDGQSNVATADELLKGVGNDRVRANGKVFIRIDADAEEDVLFQWADKKAAQPNSPEIILVHEPSVVAKSLVRDYPMWKVPGIEIDSSLCRVREGRNEFRILLIGFGAQGKALLREMVQGAVLPGASVEVTIVDEDANAYATFKTFWNGPIENERPSVAKGVKDIIDNPNLEDPTFHVSFRFEKFNVRAEDFEKWIDAEIATGAEKKILPWNRVVIALPDDLENLRLGLRLEGKYRRVDLFDKANMHPVFFVGVRREANFRYSKSLFEDAVSGGIVIYGEVGALYGDLNKIFGCDDAAAKFRSWSYEKENKGLPYTAYKDAGCPDGPWAKTSFFGKESTRDAISGLRTLIRLMGFEVVMQETGFAEKSPNVRLQDLARAVASLKENPEKLRNLAKAEHLRWNAFLIMRGVAPWYPTDEEINTLIKRERKSTTEENKNDQVIRENDRKNHLRHAALVPYGRLPDVAKRFEAANRDAGHPYETKVDKEDERTTLSMTDTLYLTNWRFAPVANANADQQG